VHRGKYIKDIDLSRRLSAGPNENAFEPSICTSACLKHNLARFAGFAAQIIALAPTLGAATRSSRIIDRRSFAEIQCFGRIVVPLIPAIVVVGPPSVAGPTVRRVRPLPLIVPRFGAVRSTIAFVFVTGRSIRSSVFGR
jgi:hypothetical protein